MQGGATGTRLRVGWMIVFAVAVVSMAYSVVIAATPLLGEEEFAGTTFAELQAANPRVANVVWHDTVAVGIVTFGAALVAALLAWKGLAKGSPIAWYSLFLLALTFLAALLLAHVPVGNTGLLHIGPGTLLLAIALVGLAIAAKPALAGRNAEEPDGDGRMRIGRATVLFAGVVLMVISAVIAVTPLPGEEDYAGVTFRELQANNPSLAALIWHDYAGFGILLFGVSLLAVVLAWKGFRMGARLAWTSLLVLGLTILAFVLVAHLPIGHNFVHYGPVLILALILLGGLATAAKPVFFAGARRTRSPE